MDVDLDQLLQHREFLTALARGLVTDPSERDELLWETMGEGATNPPPHGSLKPWLARVMRNRASDRHEARQRRQAYERAGARLDGVESAAELAARFELGHQLAMHVRALDTDYRDAVLFRFFEGLPPRAIAERLDLPIETVKTRLRRALAMLRARLDQDHGSRDKWLGCLLPLAFPGAKTAETGLIPLGVLLMALKTKVALVGLGAVLVLGAAALALEGDMRPEPEPDPVLPAPVLADMPVQSVDHGSRVDAAPGAKKPMRIRFVDHKRHGIEGLSFKLVANAGSQEKQTATRLGITGRYGIFNFEKAMPPGIYTIRLDPGYELLEGPRWQVGDTGRRSHMVVCWNRSLGISGTLLDVKGSPIADVEIQARYEWADEMIGRAVPLWNKFPLTWKEWVGDIAFTDKNGLFRLILPDDKPVHLGSLGMTKTAKICDTFHTLRTYARGTHGIRLEAKRSDVLNVRAYSDGSPGMPIEDFAVFWYFNGRPGGPYSAVGPFKDGLARVPMGKGDKRVLVVPRDPSLQIGEIETCKQTTGDLILKLRASRSLLLKVKRSDGGPIEQGEVTLVDQERFTRSIKNDFFLNATDYAEVWRSQRPSIQSEYTPWAILLTQMRASSPRITGRFVLDPHGETLLRYPDSSKMTMLIKSKGCAPAFFDLDLNAKVQEVLVQPLVDQDIQIVPRDFPRLAKGDLWVRHEQRVTSSELPMFSRGVVLDPENAARLAGMAPGNYTVTYKGRGLARRYRIPRTGGGVLQIDLAHLRPASISGRAIFSRGWPGGSTAFLFNEKYGRAMKNSNATLTASGEFEFTDTLPGTYRIGFRRMSSTGEETLLPGSALFEVKPAARVIKMVTIQSTHLILSIRTKTDTNLTGRKIRIEGEPLYVRELTLDATASVDVLFGPTKRIRVTLLPDVSWKSILAARKNPERMKPRISEWKAVTPTKGPTKLDFSF